MTDSFYSSGLPSSQSSGSSADQADVNSESNQDESESVQNSRDDGGLDDSPQDPEVVDDIRAVLNTPVADEGTLLQRGGESLPVKKMADRFTAGFTNRDRQQVTPQTAQALGSTKTRSILEGKLTEFQVSPDRLDAAMASTRTASEVAFASHAYQSLDSGESALYPTDQITLQFTKTTSADLISTIATQAGLAPVQSIEGIPNGYVFRLTENSPVNPLKLANRLMQLDDVLVAEPDVAIAVQSFYRPQDPYYAQQWHLNHAGGADLASGSHISIEAAWDVTRGSRSVVVAVIDDGFDLNHPDFQGTGKLVAPKDLKDQDNSPQPVQNYENHGTAVAGLAIAEENGSSIIGVAPGCSLMPIRYPGFLDDATIESMFNWAHENGADIISNSWGPVALYFPLSLRQKAAITQAATQGRDGKGCVVLFAAGNSNRPINSTINERGWPDNQIQGATRWLNGFAVHPDVIAVSACTSLGKKAAYSCWGNEISVTAPSNNAVPGVTLPNRGYTETGPVVRSRLRGRGMLTSDRLGADGYTRTQVVDTFGGTSSACPVVAGVAALVLSANPDLTAQEVRQILQTTTEKIIDTDADPQLGRRRGTYDVTGHSEWFGYGKVNAARAVAEAQRRLTPLPAIQRWVQSRNSSRVAIPDNNLQGATSTITISDRPPLRDIRVDVELQHGFLGDVELYLLSPQSRKIRLQSRTLGRQTRVQNTYSLQSTPLLQTLLNQSIRGQWRLLAVDHVAGDTGEIVQWRLNLGV
ncbi:MAG: S8 family serine peptidase [Elainellaceae cyanobacterium]